jgi:hypothetical protein
MIIIEKLGQKLAFSAFVSPESDARKQKIVFC